MKIFVSIKTTMKNIFSQLQKKSLFKTTLVFLILAEILSIFAWILPEFNLVTFLVILVVTLVLSLKKLEYGIYIAIVELIIGSFGYLFAFEYHSTLIPIRIGIFTIVMFAWLIDVYRNGGLNEYFKKLKEFKFFKYYLALAIVLIWGFVWALIRGNNFGSIFLDFNNWLFFLYLLPLISLSKNKEFWVNLKPVMLGALSWLILKTIILLYIFSHNFIWALPELYRWVRDTRIGEITQMSNNFYRIFIQSQIFALLAFFVSLPLYQKSKGVFNKYFFLILISLAAVIISWSRSFWLGLIAGLFFYLIYLIYSRAKFKQYLIVSGKSIIVAAFALLIILITINLPPKISGESLGSLLAKRTTVIEAAGNSRLNMLKPLGLAIADHPIIGSGFGTEVTYRSVDPRVLYATAGASGSYTTYAFEWAYLDQILKVGLAGLIIYLLLIYKVIQALLKKVKDKSDNYEFYLGLSIALLALLSVNIFTPYLNHPLGIGFILLTSTYLYKK
jgi:O-antigen ligase